RPGVLLGALPRPVDRVGAREEERRAPALLVLVGGRRHDAAGVRDLPARPRVHPRPGRRALCLRAEPLLHLLPPRAPRPRLTSATHDASCLRPPTIRSGLTAPATRRIGSLRNGAGSCLWQATHDSIRPHGPRDTENRLFAERSRVVPLAGHPRFDPASRPPRHGEEALCGTQPGRASGRPPTIRSALTAPATDDRIGADNTIDVTVPART